MMDNIAHGWYYEGDRCGRSSVSEGGCMAPSIQITSIISAHALCAWLDALRKERRISQGKIVKLLRDDYQQKTHVKDIYHYIQGNRLPNSVIRAALTRILEGSPETADTLALYGIQLETRMRESGQWPEND